MDEDGWEDVGRGFGELFGLLLEGFHEVEGVGGDGGAGGLDLAPEVLGFEDVELAAVGEVGEDVLFEADDFVFFAVVVVVAPHGEVLRVEGVGRGVGDETRAVCAALDGALDAGEDGLGGEEVDAAVDQVGDV